ncbi:hypothetical protein NCAS_0A07500 [Naumovozyma castellii]|uniref:Mto1-like Mto2p-binding domain-containing protein n=1 Tax=Naumovozyma castellii TaxID=27288 RepID=G0V760_NAUCA|nr:hypothetical protein NCAS_0A07500 [Naumovozyma castellii CBS 4309]CCC67308.1 hypothetical protein NCAS_0A07500 [Naumovozyma castellii CBS 4309]
MDENSRPINKRLIGSKNRHSVYIDNPNTHQDSNSISNILEDATSSDTLNSYSDEPEDERTSKILLESSQVLNSTRRSSHDFNLLPTINQTDYRRSNTMMTPSRNALKNQLDFKKTIERPAALDYTSIVTSPSAMSSTHGNSKNNISTDSNWNLSNDQLQNSSYRPASFDDEENDTNKEDQQENDDYDDEYGNQDTSGFDIPKLRASLTPWRQKLPNTDSTTLNQITNNNTTPTNRREATRTINKVTSNSISKGQEIEHLQKQLTSYKVKQKTLYEIIIKQLNPLNTESPNKNTNEMYNKLISTISENDEEIEEFKKIIDSKESKINELTRDLQKTKEEHAQTLEYANEYLEHSELICKTIDELLSLLIENFDVLHISKEEREALIKSQQISSTFIMVKLNSLTSTLSNFLSNSTSKNENGMAINVNGESTELIDTNFEINIESLHKQYDEFLNGIRTKLLTSKEFEDTLLTKLSDQEKLLNKISEMEQFSTTKKDELNEDLLKRSSVLSNITEMSKRASLNLTQSYQEHIDSLTNTVETLKSIVNDRDVEIENLREKLGKNENKLTRELKNFEELSKLKEKNWENLVNQLESDLEEMEKSKNKLSEVVTRLNQNLLSQDIENNKKIRALQESFNETADKVNVLNNEKLEQIDDFNKIMSKISNMEAENTGLQKIIEQFASNEKALTTQNELDFGKFKQHLLLHLNKVFEIFQKILQQKSIDQSMKKINFISKTEGLRKIKIIQPKLESLYTFIETALESILEAYITVITNEKENYKKRIPESKSELAYYQQEMELRVDELQRKWISERERRKLDANAAESRIHKLEKENEVLREQLYNISVRH